MPMPLLAPRPKSNPMSSVALHVLQGKFDTYHPQTTHPQTTHPMACLLGRYPIYVQLADDARCFLCAGSAAEARLLPGCSAATHHADGLVTISNSMMQAYVTMRGPWLGGDDDPLFEWIRLREDVQDQYRNPRPGDRKDISRMLAKIDKVLDSENPAGDSPRDAIFQIERPATQQHIAVPPRMDLSMHVLSACCADFEFEDEDPDDDTEDDEDNDGVPSGRISPCTFLAWSEGCTRWNTLDNRPQEIENAQRVRPPTPESCDTPPDSPRPHRYPPWGEQQFDKITGEEFSPYYPVPSSPSIVYVPEGIDTDRLESLGFEAQYNRMDPAAGKKLRKLKKFELQETASPSGENECYTYTEVEQVVEDNPTAFGPGLSGPDDIRAHVGQRYGHIVANEQASNRLAALLREQKTELRVLAQQRDEVAGALAALRRRRDEAAARARAEQRRRRIADHVSNHIREVGYSYERSCARLAAARRDMGDNDEAIAGLRRDIQALCDQAELGEGATPEDVFAALEGVRRRARRDRCSSVTLLHRDSVASSDHETVVQLDAEPEKPRRFRLVTASERPASRVSSGSSSGEGAPQSEAVEKHDSEADESDEPDADDDGCF